MRETIFNSVFNFFFFFCLSRYGPPTRTENRVIVENLSSRVSWQVSNFQSLLVKKKKNEKSGICIFFLLFSVPQNKYVN